MNAEKMRDLRRQRRMTVTDLARAAGVSREHMSNVLAGRRNLSPDAIDAAADALGVMPGELLTAP